MKPNFQRLDECPNEYQNFKNIDEGESIFFARELEHIKAKTYDIKFQELKARMLFPLEFEANAGAETITYEQYDQTGIAKIISNYADDLPRADVKGKEFTARVRTIASSYGYNFDEVQAATKAGKPLKPKKAKAALRAHRVLENKIAFFGDATHDIKGFLSNQNIQEVTVPADGTGSSKALADKTPDQMIRDLTSLFTAVHKNSKGVETANVLLLTLDNYNLIANTRVTDTETTVMEWILKKNPFLEEIVWVNELEGAGAGGVDRTMVYRRDPEVLTMEIPSEFKQLPVQEKNLEFVVPTHQRFGGVIIYYPLAIAFADGL